MTSKQKTPRLTAFSPGAGCGCKVAPDLLSCLLKEARGAHPFHDPALVVGFERSDDALAYRLPQGPHLLFTTDFFTPIVDDPATFGAVAAANALSDIYAMGGRPLVALALLGLPIGKLGQDTAAAILKGAMEKCARAGIAIGGGHTIDVPAPIFGLAVAGMPAHHERILRNEGARPGDLLFLTKPIGIGIYTTAMKKGMLEEEDARVVIEWMTRLNTVGMKLAADTAVHAMTDVTGFSLMGHLQEMCEASGTAAEITWQAVPRLPRAEEYARAGAVPGGTRRNQRAFGACVQLEQGIPAEVAFDPQTSGGLLVAVDPSFAATFQKLAAAENLPSMVPIGRMLPADKPHVTVKR